MKPLSLADRLGKVSYRNQANTASQQHIVVDTEICNTRCPHRCTTYVCPANCYTVDSQQQIHFQYEDCIECGACFFACDQGAVAWSYPHPQHGRGVNWNFG